jgi:ABC-type arginine transport system permease subunit
LTRTFGFEKKRSSTSIVLPDFSRFVLPGGLRIVIALPA